MIIFFYMRKIHRCKISLLIKKQEKTGLKYYKYFKAVIEYSNYIFDINEMLKNTIQLCNILIVFDNMNSWHA